MMFAVEMFTIITIAMMSAKQVLSNETCLNACKHPLNQTNSLQHECNCTATGEEALPSKLISNESENTSIEDGPVEYNNVSESSQQINISDGQNRLNISEISELEDESNNSFEKYRQDEKSYNINGSEYLIKFPLYLDVDLTTKVNDQEISNLKEELKDLFDKIRVSEKDVSECINLHIYIFSKYNNSINKTHAQWGHHVQYDNVSNSEVLTEIEKKCNEPATIIHESIYEIRQRKHNTKYNFTENNFDKDNISKYDNEIYARNLSNVSTTLTKSRSAMPDFENNLLKSSLAPLENGNVNRRIIANQTLYVSIQSDQKSSKCVNTTKFKRIIMPDGSRRMMKRGEYLEKDIHITKIITKELPNNTVTSVIAGLESIPNLDFNHSNISRTTINDNIDRAASINENQVSASDIPNLKNTNHSQSNLVQDLKGNLYFSFGNEQIPARFIQNFEGEMHLAVDGVSLCDHMVQNQQDKPVFIKVLCNCIQLHDCSLSLH